jgi:radical SAM superfamily enzyme YgiQ (UPF0313 family)
LGNEFNKWCYHTCIGLPEYGIIIQLIFGFDDHRRIPILHQDEIHENPCHPAVTASLDLSEDDELIQLMVDANIVCVFIGIESPNEESLRETKKFQNVRPGDTLVGRVRKIQELGIEVWCGMILGFDHDDASVFVAQREFLRQTDIMHAMIGMLSAIPKTPLYDRLRREGRLDEDDDSEFGTNVIPLRLTREDLRDGYVRLMQTVYESDFYFERFESLFFDRRLDYGRTRSRYWRRHPWVKWRMHIGDAVKAAVLYLRLMTYVADPALRREYRRRTVRTFWRRPDPNVWFIFMLKCALHYHYHTMSRELGARPTLVNTF